MFDDVRTAQGQRHHPGVVAFRVTRLMPGLPSQDLNRGQRLCVIGRTAANFG